VQFFIDDACINAHTPLTSPLEGIPNPLMRGDVVEGKDGRRVASLPENDTGITSRCNAGQAREPADSLGRYFASPATLLEIPAEVEVATHRGNCLT